ncbi:MAG: hypothetical protein ACXV3V_01095 [Actinomycetes bacterium]
MGPTTSHDLRCPRCAARSLPDAEWCTLCYADLRPAPEPAPPAPEPEPVTGESQPHVDVPSALGSRGKHARRVRAHDPADPADPAEPVPAGLQDVDVDLMLAQLSAETAVALPGFLDRVESKGARVAIMCGGVAGIAVVLLVLMTVVGSLL